MFTRSVPAAAAAATIAGFAAAGTTQQTVQFDYQPLTGTVFLDIQKFDTMGGTRKLENVNFTFRHNFRLSLFLESTGPTPIAAGDFGMNFFFLSVMQLGTLDENGEGSFPFFGPGGVGLTDFTAALGAYDGIAGNNGADSANGTFTDAFTSSFTFLPDEQPVLDALTGTGSLTTVYGGFTELQFWWNNDPGWAPPLSGIPEYPTDPALWLEFREFQHWGEIDVTYEFSQIPAPMSALPLIGLAAIARRRRVA